MEDSQVGDPMVKTGELITSKYVGLIDTQVPAPT